MLRIIFGIAGTLWGTFVLYSVLRGPSMPNDCDQYAAAQVRGAIFGTLLFVIGMYLLIKGVVKYKKSP